MKKTTMAPGWLVLVLLGTAGALAAAAPGGRPGAGGGARCEDALVSYLQSLPAASLETGERDALLAMREEEKLARDVYSFLDATWGLRAFSNIARAEQNHMNAVLAMLERYGLDDPAAGNPPGRFENPEFQQLYDKLTADGAASLVSALRVGMLVEETDIADLDEALIRADNEDLEALWQNLARGSRNHLRAFAGLLERNGVDAEPTVLDPERVDRILSTPRERGIVDAEGEPVPGACPDRGRGPRRGRRGWS